MRDDHLSKASCCVIISASFLKAGMTAAHTVTEKLRDLWVGGRNIAVYSEPFAIENRCQDRVVMTGSSTWKASELPSGLCHVFIDREEDLGENVYFSDVVGLQSFALSTEGVRECLEAFIGTCRKLSVPYIGSLGIDAQDIDEYLKRAIHPAAS